MHVKMEFLKLTWTSGSHIYNGFFSTDICQLFFHLSVFSQSLLFVEKKLSKESSHIVRLCEIIVLLFRDISQKEA